MTSMTPLQKIGGRKFFAIVLVIVLASLLVWFSKISDGVYSTILLALVPLFFGANVSQKALVKQSASSLPVESTTITPKTVSD